jgi:ABC-type multidrug transport system ATPase subunit
MDHLKVIAKIKGIQNPSTAIKEAVISFKLGKFENMRVDEISGGN